MSQDIDRIADGVWSFTLREQRPPTLRDLVGEIGMPREWIEARWRRLTRLDLGGGASLLDTPRMFEFVRPDPRFSDGEVLRPTYASLLMKLSEAMRSHFYVTPADERDAAIAEAARLREALLAIATGAISPAIGLATRVLLGQPLAEAHAAEVKQARGDTPIKCTRCGDIGKIIDTRASSRAAVVFVDCERCKGDTKT